MVVIETVEGKKLNLEDVEEIWLVEIDNNDYNKNIDVKRYNKWIYTDEDFMDLLKEVESDMTCMPHRCRRLLVEPNDGYYNRKEIERFIVNGKSYNADSLLHGCLGEEV
jgi:hypothetical protein